MPMLKIEWPKSDDGPVSRASRYTLKGDPYSSHSVILDWLGDGRGRRLLDVGAADGLLSRRLTERGWKVTGLEADPAAAAAAAAAARTVEDTSALQQPYELVSHRLFQ